MTEDRTLYWVTGLFVIGGTDRKGETPGLGPLTNKTAETIRNIKHHLVAPEGAEISEVCVYSGSSMRRSRLIERLPLVVPVVPQPDGIRARALALYQAPFRYDKMGGYIWDSANEMVADKAGLGAVQVARIRGWGRIGYMEDPDKLQDAVGELIAEALTKLWQEQKR